MGMSLNPGDADNDEDVDPNKVTPNTKQRDQMGINSPRNKQKQDWDDDTSGGAASLVTQVQRPDSSADYKRDDGTSQEIQQAQSSGGMC